jgi:hypothetical protein
MRDFTASGGSIRRALVGPDIGHCVSRRRIILALTIDQQNCSAAEVSRLQFRQLAEMPPGSSAAAAGTSTAGKAQWVASDFLSQAERKSPIFRQFLQMFPLFLSI